MIKLIEISCHDRNNIYANDTTHIHKSLPFNPLLYISYVSYDDVEY